MRLHTGQIIEIQLDYQGREAAWIACPQAAWPKPGQYLAADDGESVLNIALFCGATAKGAFLALPPLPSGWRPGMPLNLAGPLGHGFQLPETSRRLVLADFSWNPAHLLALLPAAMAQGASVALFSDAALPQLHAAVEAFPLSALPESLGWADFLSLTLQPDSLPHLRAGLGLEPGQTLSCPSQVLMLADMPCAARAECGACAVPASPGGRRAGRSGWLLTCKDGPVFNLEELEW